MCIRDSLIAVHIHHYMEHLSALCGILIAGTGAASAITYLMGGTYENMVNTIKTMCSNLTGMMLSLIHIFHEYFPNGLAFLISLNIFTNIKSGKNKPDNKQQYSNSPGSEICLGTIGNSANKSYSQNN